MGQEQKKYHISDNGDIFKFNEDGSFTKLGNAEDLNKPKQLQKADINKTKSSKSLWVILSLAIIIIVINIFSPFSSESFSNGVDSVEVSDEYYDFDEWRVHAYNYIQELIASPSKSHYDSPSYSATDYRINAAINMFYEDKYAEVEENMFYPAFRQNNATAQYYLGCIYANGNQDIIQDSKKAFYWFEIAAVNGHGSAAYYLARDYCRDWESKRYWMQKAADLNDGEAMLALAESYENGYFTEIDVNKAIGLYKRIINTFGESDSLYSYEAAERLKVLN